MGSVLSEFPYIDAAWFFLLCLAIVRGSSNLLSGWILLRTAFVFLEGYDPFVQVFFDKSAAFFLISIASVWWVSKWRLLGDVFPILAVLSAMITAIELSLGQDPRGLIGNPSLNGTFIVCALPLCLHMHFLVIAFMASVVVAAALTGSGTSIPIMLLALVWGSYLFARFRVKAAWPILIPIGGIILGYYLVPEFFSSSGRFERWELIFSNWEGSFLFGTGGGSFQVLGPAIQRANGSPAPYLLNLHSDWGQLFLEFGLIGLFLMLGFCVRALRESFPHPALFSARVGMIAAAIFNWPLHHALTFLFFFHTFTAFSRAKRQFLPQLRSLLR